MDTFIFLNLVALWAFVLLNLSLTFRIVRYFRAMAELRQQAVEREHRPELSIGEPAPDFTAKTLLGHLVSRKQYLTHAVLFLFVSPHCSRCRKEIPMFSRLGVLVHNRFGIEFVLVSDASARDTNTWLQAIHDEDGFEVKLPIVIAPPNASDFQAIYNPRGLYPYFCLINAQGMVEARSPVGSDEWMKLKQQWEGITTVLPSQTLANRYR